MDNFILILACIVFGYAIRRAAGLPSDAYKAVNAWVLYVALPSMSLRYTSAIDWKLEMLLPLLGPMLMWCGAWFYIRAYARRKQLDTATRVALTAGSGLGNAAFLGFPLITAFYGADALGIAVVFELGGFIIFSTFATAMILGAADGGGRLHPGKLLKKMLCFPAFLAFLAAIILPRFMDMSPAYPFLDLLAVTLSPLSLFSIGLQLEFKEVGQNLRHIFTGLFYKLLISPVIVLFLALALGASGQVAQVSIVEAGMGPHITALLFASQYNHNPRLCGLMVGIGIMCALVTTPLLWQLMELLF